MLTLAGDEVTIAQLGMKCLLDHIELAHGKATIELSVVIKALGQALDGMDGLGYEILQAYDPTFTNPSEEIVQLALATSKKTSSSEAVPNVRVGASDARLYRTHDVPSVVLELKPHIMGGAGNSLKRTRCVNWLRLML